MSTEPAVTVPLEIPLKSGGAITVQAEQPAPGLYVYEVPVEHRADGGEQRPWRLAHHRGLLIGRAPSRAAAMRAVEDLAGLTDWTQTPDELLGSSMTGPARVDANDVAAALDRANCTILVRP